jgi:hypothetical protein
VEFGDEAEAKRACVMDGKEMGKSGRRLRINPASNKPATR